METFLELLASLGTPVVGEGAFWLIDEEEVGTLPSGARVFGSRIEGVLIVFYPVTEEVARHVEKRITAARLSA